MSIAPRVSFAQKTTTGTYTNLTRQRLQQQVSTPLAYCRSVLGDRVNWRRVRACGSPKTAQPDNKGTVVHSQTLYQQYLEITG